MEREILHFSPLLRHLVEEGEGATLLFSNLFSLLALYTKQAMLGVHPAFLLLIKELFGGREW